MVGFRINTRKREHTDKVGKLILVGHAETAFEYAVHQGMKASDYTPVAVEAISMLMEVREFETVAFTAEKFALGPQDLIQLREQMLNILPEYFVKLGELNEHPYVSSNQMGSGTVGNRASYELVSSLATSFGFMTKDIEKAVERANAILQKRQPPYEHAIYAQLRP
ncbi:MAG: hypothetical protein KGH64_05895 [Candidatus Micrarchaeota archaeon]|nr:hypothetical protein [Candidatus Micrarchaeota archaeon]MDE1834839.1 hypothetical protein [Candidatus Micrarchaeota archaeon]MDE1859998.1 hypothetical protein [Candidatus Micrarchaeota archaeon]